MTGTSRWRLAGATAILAATTVLVSACASGGTTDAAAASAQPTPGGEAVLALDGDPVCLDPAQASLTNSLSIGAQFTDTLVDQDFETGAITPYLASSWEVDPSGTSFTFHLRDGVTFSDGTPLNADAVKANFDGIVALGARAALGSSYLAGYQGTQVVDPSTVTVTFAQPNVPFLQAAATSTLGILSPATNQLPAEARCQGNLVGSGPFLLTSYTANSEVVLTKRTGYNWGPATANHQGEAYLDTVRMPIVRESGVRSGGLQSGEFQGVFNVASQDQDLLEGQGYPIVARANPGNLQAMVANTFRPLVADQTVRRAVQKSIDRTEFRDTLGNARYPVANSVLSETTPGYVDLSSDLAADPAEAQRLLDADGWVPGPDGIRVKDGQRLELVFLTVSGFQPATELAQSQLRRVGIDSRINLVESAQLFPQRAAGDWDYVFNALTRADPDVLRRDFWSGGQPNAAAHLTPSPLDEPILAQRAETDPTRRMALVADIQRDIVEEGYAVPYITMAQVYATSPQLHDLRLDASSRLRLYDTFLTPQ